MSPSLSDRLHLKDPRVPAAILLAMTSLACTPAPSVPRGGIRNNALQDVVVRGTIRGQRYEATLSPGATLWLEGAGDEELEIDVYDASGSQIADDVAIMAHPWETYCRQVVQDGRAIYVTHFEPDWRKERERREQERLEHGPRQPTSQP